MFRKLFSLGAVLALLLLSITATACGSTESPSNPGTAQVTSPVGNSEEGKALFVSKGCAGCHVVEGMPQAVGTAGPDLTHFAIDPLIAGALVRNDENMRRWLSDPPAVKKGTLMPKSALTGDEMADIVAFLNTLK